MNVCKQLRRSDLLRCAVAAFQSSRRYGVRSGRTPLSAALMAADNSSSCNNSSRRSSCNLLWQHLLPELQLTASGCRLTISNQDALSNGSFRLLQYTAL